MRDRMAGGRTILEAFEAPCQRGVPWGHRGGHAVRNDEGGIPGRFPSRLHESSGHLLQHFGLPAGLLLCFVVHTQRVIDA